ncbi:MAG TPA: hypothetical protein VFL69_04005 [Marmoricola sp.]|jgi:hypothetical protein|nr:hypothetical protein [Marmoricola sp.]
MTSRGTGPTWLVAPLAAGTFALAAQWTLHHEPAQPSTQGAAPRAASAGLVAVQHDARLAARRLARVQASVLRLESSVQKRSARADRLEAALRAVRQGGGAGAAVSQSGGAAAPLAAALPPVQVPSSVHTTTGAS